MRQRSYKDRRGPLRGAGVSLPRKPGKGTQRRSQRLVDALAGEGKAGRAGLRP
jgi:hypothetical protein